jgi:FKBP12-rapamycin complex-associated protein
VDTISLSSQLSELQRNKETLNTPVEKKENEEQHVLEGRMRCLDALGRWEELSDLATDAWTRVKDIERNDDGSTPAPYTESSSTGANSRCQVALLGGKACWALSDWKGMQAYVDELPDRHDTNHALHFFKSVLAIHSEQYTLAQDHIELARKAMDETLSSLVSESYGRAYSQVVMIQQLVELEEVIDIRKKMTFCAEGEAKNGSGVSHQRAWAKDMLRRTRERWDKRIMNMKRDVSVWTPLVLVRRLVLEPADDIEIWLQFASLCRKSGRLSQSLTSLNILAESYSRIRSKARDCHVNNFGVSLSSSSNIFCAIPINTIAKCAADATPGSSPAAFLLAHQEGGTLDVHPTVAIAYLKHIWEAAACYESQKCSRLRSVALEHLKQLTTFIDNDGVTTSRTTSSESLHSAQKARTAALSAHKPKLASMKIRCHLKIADWRHSLHEQQENTPEVDEALFDDVLNHVGIAKDLGTNSYKAWHAWALMNFQVVQYYANRKKEMGENPAPIQVIFIQDKLTKHAVSAVNGFFRSIVLGRNTSSVSGVGQEVHVLQDILRLLTLWFAPHGHNDDSPDVYRAMKQGFETVSVDTWLEVVPQLIARIHTNDVRTSDLLVEILTRVGCKHPQVLIYPITVAAKSVRETRQTAALKIMAAIRKQPDCAELVDQAQLVSKELIRVAILWHEMWDEALEEASKMYFGEGNEEGMMEQLEPLHKMMECKTDIDSKGRVTTSRGAATTLKEIAFQQAFGRDLSEAHEWLQRYKWSKSKSDLNQAWDLYYHVFRRISRQLEAKNLTELELQHVAPQLLNARNLALAVPGTYMVGRPVVRINSFKPTVAVITSKQRPRKVYIHGDDGKEYVFLLKGHEDLRQDERVMQLFGLVNVLLATDDTTAKKDLSIQRFSITPLSHSAGLVGWVGKTDTLHALIREYREPRRIPLIVEQKLMEYMAPDYDKLPLINKVEVFKHALANTSGQHLAKVLWLKSQNAEVWLERRRNYTRTLAVMSMVGYILGLGDRHPSNLMLARDTGRVVHIDFGDCFEVAMDREKFPEKIPFRLTRMLVMAMEVSGIEGNYRTTCENVMDVLRINRDSLMAILEAFVHDPLINWRGKEISDTTAGEF